jgi:hypothetical protein
MKLNFVFILLALNLVGCASSTPAVTSDVKADAEVSSNAPMGRTIAGEVFRKTPLTENSEVLTYVNTVGRYVGNFLKSNSKCPTARATSLDQVRVAVVRSENRFSYALPGGIAVLSDSFLRTLQTEDQLAGVLARELSTSLCERGMPVDLASQAADSWAGYISSLTAQPLPKAVLDIEDRTAFSTLYSLGYQIAPYIAWIEANENNPRTRHPMGKARAANLKKLIAKANLASSDTAARDARFQAALRALN